MDEETLERLVDSWGIAYILDVLDMDPVQLLIYLEEIGEVNLNGLEALA